jgi:hypothetical protein
MILLKKCLKNHPYSPYAPKESRLRGIGFRSLTEAIDTTTLGVDQSHGLHPILAEARARCRFTTAAGEGLDPAFALRRWAGAEKIRDLLGRQAGARHPTPAASRSIRPFA